MTVQLTRVDFVHPVQHKGGGITGVILDGKATTFLELDLNTGTIHMVRHGEHGRIPVSNVRDFKFADDGKLPAPVKK